MGNYRVPYLTDRQERIVAFIRERITETGEAPMLAEIGEAVGLRSSASVHYQLTQIAEKGHILREPRLPRGIILLR
ncbi:LexA family protein [Streptomyces sp. NPDC004532]